MSERDVENQLEKFEEVLNQAIANAKAGQQIDDLLKTINTTNADFELQRRLDKLGIDFNQTEEEFCFLIPMKEGINADYFFDYFDDVYTEINTYDDSEVSKEIYKGIERYLSDMPPHIAMKRYHGLILSVTCHILGQAGPDFSDLNIFKTKEECKQYYIKKGWVISRNGLSHCIPSEHTGHLRAKS